MSWWGIRGSAYRQNLWAELIIKNPCWYEQHIYETVCNTSEIWIFEGIFVDFRLTKNIIFNKTEIFVERNISNHACQIFCPKSNCETMYHWFFLLKITMVKKINNLNVCSAHSYLYPWSWFKTEYLHILFVYRNIKDIV